MRPSAPNVRSWTTTGLCGVRRNGTWPSWSRSVSDERLKTRSAMAVAPNWTTSLRLTNVGSIDRPAVHGQRVGGARVRDELHGEIREHGDRELVARHGGIVEVDRALRSPTHLVRARLEHERAPGLGAGGHVTADRLGAPRRVAELGAVDLEAQRVARDDAALEDRRIEREPVARALRRTPAGSAPTARRRTRWRRRGGRRRCGTARRRTGGRPGTCVATGSGPGAPPRHSYPGSRSAHLRHRWGLVPIDGRGGPSVHLDRRRLTKEIAHG